MSQSQPRWYTYQILISPQAILLSLRFVLDSERLIVGIIARGLLILRHYDVRLADDVISIVITAEKRSFSWFALDVLKLTIEYWSSNFYVTYGCFSGPGNS